jgi:cobalt-zinc-cadmium efflux system outer membrane protein
VKAWLLGLALLPVLDAAALAQSQAPPLGTGPTSLGPQGGGGRAPVAVPPLPGAGGTGQPQLQPLPGTGGPSLTDLDITSQAGAQPRSGRAAAARAPARVAAPRLLLPYEASVALRAAVDAAVSRNAGLQGAVARKALIAAKQRSAAAFLPGAPTLGAAYVTDQVIRNRNARDAELSLGTQIWLPGEGTASVRAAAADMSRLQAEGVRQVLEVAGQVREALAAVAVAEADQRAAQARLRDARALEADLARRVRGRDAAEAELLVANADRIEAEATLSEKTASLDAARVDYRTLTGLDPVTAALNEPSVPPAQARPPDPRIIEAQRAVEVARANRELAAIQIRDSPEVGLVGRRTRDINGNVYDHSLGLQLRIPFATETRNAPRRAAAEVEYTDAVAALAKLERELGGSKSRARIELASAVAARDLAAKRAAVFERQRALFEKSFAEGNTALADLIRARTLAFQADAARERADVGARQARGRLNQALGLMP